MIRLVFRYTMAFIFLILLQVLVLNNMHLSFLINPYVYLLILLILPFETPGWLSLSLAFLSGILIDAFSNTPGMHSAAMVLLAFIREYLLGIMAPRDGYESGQTPHYGEMGLIWFLIYAGILTLLHHVFLFTLEDFTFSRFFTILLKAILSSVFSLIIMLVLMLYSYKPKR